MILKNEMKLMKRVVMNSLITFMIIFVCALFASLLQVNAEAPDIDSTLESEKISDAQLQTVVPNGVVPKDGWNNNQWALYKRRITQTLTTSQVAYYIDIDGEALTGKNIFYASSNITSSDSLDDSENYVPVLESEDFPGIYVFDTDKVKTWWEFRIYDKGETDPFKYMQDPDLGYSEDNFTIQEQRVCVRHIYSVTYTQGEIDIKYFINQLPAKKYFVSGQSFSGPNLESNYGGTDYSNSGYFAGAYCFSHWADEENNEYSNYSSTVTKTMVVHTVYNNIQDNHNSSVAVESVDSIQKLLENITVVGKKEVQQNMTTELVNPEKILVIDKPLVLDKQAFADFMNSETVTGFFEKYAEKYYRIENYMGINEDSTGRFKWDNDMIVIADGGSLTIDGVQVGEGVAGHHYIAVQAGGELHLQNDGNLRIGYDDRGIVISLQKDANMAITGAHADIHHLDNHGTITLNKPESIADESMSWAYLNVEGEFFNAKDGVIQSNYGKIVINNGDNYHVYRKDGEKTKLVPNANSGMMRITKEGALELDASSAGGDDHYLAIPFLNEGTIQCDSCPSLKFYGAPFNFEYSKLHNTKTGKIIIAQPAHEIEEDSNMDKISYYRSSCGLQITSAMLINEGELNFKAVNGSAARADTQSPYYDVDGYDSTGLCDEDIYAGIYNLEGGSIILESTKDSIGYVNGEGCVLHNEGTITVNNTDTEGDIDNITLCNSGLIQNDGTIENNGGIGQRYSSTLNLFNVKGNAFTGSGTESYYYYISALDSNEYSIPQNVQVNISIDGTNMATTKGSESYYCFLPKNKTFQVTAKANGYVDGIASIKTGTDIAEYIGEGNYKRKYGFNILMGSANPNSGEDNPGNIPGEETPSEESPGSGNGSATGGGNNGNSGGSSPGGDAGNTGNNGNTGDTGNSGNAGAENSKPVNNTKPVASNDGSKVTTTSNGDAAISEVKKTNSKSITVSSTTTVDGVKYNVTTINANAFKNATKAKTVTLPNTITKIKANAFASSKIETVKITIKKGGKLTIDKKAFKKSKVKKVQVTMNKKATKKEQNAVINALKKAGIKVKNIKIKLK